MTGQERGDLGREFTRMLGPAGPEIGCDECFDRLDAYVELELAGTKAELTMPAMHAHLIGCPACREDHDSLIEFVRSNRSKNSILLALRTAPPADYEPQRVLRFIF